MIFFCEKNVDLCMEVSIIVVNGALFMKKFLVACVLGVSTLGADFFDDMMQQLMQHAVVQHTYERKIHSESYADANGKLVEDVTKRVDESFVDGERFNSDDEACQEFEDRCFKSGLCLYNHGLIRNVYSLFFNVFSYFENMVYCFSQKFFDRI